MTEIRVLPDPLALGQAAAEYLLVLLRQSRTDGRYNIALSGGSTPRLMYDQLADNPEAGTLFNERARFFFSDERPVGPDDPRSNYRLAADHFFRPLGISPDIVHRLRGETAVLAAEALRYEQEVRQYVPPDDESIPRFDLIFLGMGDDGHTASLFPDYPFNTDATALIVAPYVKAVGSKRLSFSLYLINHAATVLFLVAGEKKAEQLAQVLSRTPKEPILPTARVAAEKVIWMVDAAAAKHLNRNDDRMR